MTDDARFPSRRRGFAGYLTAEDDKLPNLYLHAALSRETMSTDETVSQWLDRLQSGDDAAAQQLWQRYYSRLLALATRQLGATPKRVADEEDVVLSAFHSFCAGAKQGRFPRLEDRDDLWRLLVTITQRKVIGHRRRSMRQKRGGGQVRGGSVFARPDSSGHGGGIDAVVGNEPSPEFAAAVIESMESLLEQLNDSTLRELALMKLEGYKNDEIARQMGVTTRSVERKLARIRLIWSAEETA